MVWTVAACHGGPVHKPGDEWLAPLRVHGNRSIDTDTLVEGLGLYRAQQGGRGLDPYQLSLDADRVRGVYLRRGFFDVDVRTHVDRNGKEQIVTFNVEEGVRATTQVEITGLPDDAGLHAKVRAALPLADGAPFDYDVYDLAKTPLTDVVEDVGYAHAHLASGVVADRARHVAVVKLDYELGPACTFGEIVINGANADLVAAARARLKIKQGEHYSTHAIEASRSGLYQMGRFSTVRIDPDTKGDATVIPVKISLAEGARHETQLGGGFGIDPLSYEARGRAGYSVAGWPSPLTTTAVDLRPAYALLRDESDYQPRVRALVSMTRTDLYRPYLTGSVEVGLNYLVVEAYTSLGPHLRLGLATPIVVPQIQFRIGWQLEIIEFENINPLVDPDTIHRLGLDTTQRTGKYEAALSIDLRDHPLEPRYGIYAEMRAAVGTPFAGSELQFLEITPDVRGYLPLGPFVLAARARYGGIFGEVPVTERYYAGGASSNRGFSERRLAPTLAGYLDGQLTSIPIGGAGLIDSSAEIRAPLGTLHGFVLGSVIFLDGSDVTDSPSELDPFNLHWSLGAGLRVATLIGPVRFDVGRRLNRYGTGEPELGSLWAFHLSLGEAY